MKKVDILYIHFRPNGLDCHRRTKRKTGNAVIQNFSKKLTGYLTNTINELDITSELQNKHSTEATSEYFFYIINCVG
jgi:hypothetical protein